ncbi:MAG: MFS transporter [Solirubrobacterales bacterium]
MSAAPPGSRGSGPAFAGVFALTFCGLLAVGAVLPVLPGYVKHELGYGDVAVGIVIGCYAISGLLLRPLAGRFADTRGRKRTALVGALLLSAGGFLYLVPLGLGGLIVARMILGIGEGTVYPAGSAWIVDLAPPARRGRILGLYGLAVWGGLAVGPLFGILIHNAAGYEAVWLFAALLPLVGALAGLAVGDPFQPLAEAEPHPLVAPEAVRPGIAVGLAAIGYATVAAFVVLLLERRGIDQGAAVFAAFGGAIVLGRLALGDLPDRVGPAPVAVGATITEAVGLLTIAVAESLPVALLGGVAMGCGFALINPALMLIVVDQVGASARGAALGTFTAFFDLGVGVGAPLAGLAASLTSYEGAFVLAGVLALASSATVCLTGPGRSAAGASETRLVR